MPIVKQVLYGANIYAECCHEELLDDYDSILENISMQQHHDSTEREDPQTLTGQNDSISVAQSNLRSARAFTSILGVLHQLSYLTVTANDIFKSLTLISSDTQERIRRLSSRTADLLVSSPKVGSRMKFNNTTERRPDAVVPSLFMKNTNCAGLLNLFRLCKPVPQLWRIEMYLPSGEDSCYKSYSYPGFFFERWVQAELQRQRAQREQRKADKKAIRLEKRKIRDQETMNRLEGNDSAGQHQQSSVPVSMAADQEDEAIVREEPATLKVVGHPHPHSHSQDGEEDLGRSSNATTLQQMKLEIAPASKASLSSAQPIADKHRSVISKVFRFNKSDKATAAANSNAEAAAVTPEKLEKKSSVLMDIVRQTTLDKLASRRLEEEEAQASKADNTAGSARSRVKDRDRDRDRDKHKGKDKSDPSSLTGKPRARVTMFEGDNPSQASPLPSASEREDALPRGKSRGSVVERKVIPKRSSKVRKYNAERFMQSDLVDYATEAKSSPMGETAAGITIASQSSAVDASRPLQRPSILQDTAASEVQNRRQQVMSMKLGSKIVVSSAGNFSSKNKGRQSSVIVRSAVPTSANISDSDTTVNALIGRRFNKLSEGSEGGSSRNGSIRSRSNSFLNYDRGRTLLPRYEEDEHSEEESQRKDFEPGAASEGQEEDKGSSPGAGHPHPKPPPPPPGWAAKESPEIQESASPVLRPPPPPPPVPRPALPADILGGIRSRKGDGEGDNGLRKVPEPQAKPLDPMAGLLLSIKSGSKNLKSVPAEALATKASKPVEQNKAIAAILANRSKIAGSDSDSDDSDSDFTDDMY